MSGTLLVLRRADKRPSVPRLLPVGAVRDPLHIPSHLREVAVTSALGAVAKLAAVLGIPAASDRVA